MEKEIQSADILMLPCFFPDEHITATNKPDNVLPVLVSRNEETAIVQDIVDQQIKPRQKGGRSRVYLHRVIKARPPAGTKKNRRPNHHRRQIVTHPKAIGIAYDDDESANDHDDSYPSMLVKSLPNPMHECDDKKKSSSLFDDEDLNKFILKWRKDEDEGEVANFADAFDRVVDKKVIPLICQYKMNKDVIDGILNEFNDETIRKVIRDCAEIEMMLSDMDNDRL